MDHLSKQQLILLALLVSFVTSLATGIFTVSLMSQAPQGQGVVQTISQVVEKIVTPQNASVSSAVSIEEKIPLAVSIVSKSIVKLRNPDLDKITGLGIVVSKSGVVLADKSIIPDNNRVEVIFSDGSHYPMTVIQSQIKGDIAFLILDLPDKQTLNSQIASNTFIPILFAKFPKLGQSVLTLSGTESSVLGQGIVSKTLLENINPDGSQPALVDTTISASKANLGSPLFNLDGEVIGISTLIFSKNQDTSAFYPIGQLKVAIPKI
ncbi:MAG: S1C family serine protease [Patescibacteria group bacterium]